MWSRCLLACSFVLSSYSAFALGLPTLGGGSGDGSSIQSVFAIPSDCNIYQRSGSLKNGSYLEIWGCSQDHSSEQIGSDLIGVFANITCSPLMTGNVDGTNATTVYDCKVLAYTDNNDSQPIDQTGCGTAVTTVSLPSVTAQNSAAAIAKALSGSTLVANKACVTKLSFSKRNFLSSIRSKAIVLDVGLESKRVVGTTANTYVTSGTLSYCCTK